MFNIDFRPNWEMVSKVGSDDVLYYDMGVQKRPALVVGE